MESKENNIYLISYAIIIIVYTEINIQNNIMWENFVIFVYKALMSDNYNWLDNQNNFYSSQYNSKQKIR